MKRHLLAIILIFTQLTTWAENIKEDRNLIKGRLEKGLTYYIKQNDNPKDKVELRLVINAGSALEEESQRGLAHFLEHLAFSGTRDFPGLKLIDTLETVGVKFGKELNAYTSFDETVYSLPIPSKNIELGIKVIENWAFHLNLTEEAIDRERGVILEEMRLGEGSRKRIQEQYLPIIFEGSPYSNRLPIGTEEVVKNCEYDEIRRFYNTWYRPDLMAIIAIGDINPKEIETLIQNNLNKSKKEVINKPRPSYFPTPHLDPKVVIATDQERNSCSVEIMYKHKPERNLTVDDYTKSLKNSLYRSIMLERLEIIQERSKTPFYDAETSYSSHFRYVDSYSMFAYCEHEDIKATISLLLEENQRVIKYGFSNEELDRAKIKLLAKYERWYKEEDKTASDLWADIYQTAYLFEQPAADFRWELKNARSILNKITPEQVSQLSKEYTSKGNAVISIIGPSGHPVAYPSSEELITLLNNSEKLEISPFLEVPNKSILFDKKVKKGKIVKKENIDSLGLTLLSLSNGLNVILKPTNYKNDEVLFRSTSNGGYSSYKSEDAISAVNATLIQDKSGVNGINNIQLKRLMAGKNLSIKQYLTFNYEAMWGKSGLDELEYLFQFIHLYHTKPYFNKNVAEKHIKKEKADYDYLKKTPSSSFDYYVDSLMNGGDFRTSPWPLPEVLDKIDIERAEEIYKDRFSNAEGFTYMFVGNLAEKRMERLIEKYIASLPTASKTSTNSFKRHIQEKGGKHYFYKGTEDKSTVKIRFIKKKDENLYSEINYKGFIEILNSRLFESLRMQMSGVYGVAVSGDIPDKNIPYSKLNITFGCDPKMSEKLIVRLDQELKKLYEEGPTQEEVDKYKEKTMASLQAYYNSNGYSLNELLKSVRENSLPKTLQGAEKEVENIDIESIKKAGKQNLDPSNGNYFIHLPEVK